MAVLYVDDDPNDTELLRVAARKAGIEVVLHNVEDGEGAIAFLSGSGIYADRNQFQMPSLVLLDLKMPRTTGFEILKWVRKRPEFGALPVVVLSGSQLQDDIERAYEIGANSYLIKPLGFASMVSLLKNIHATWLTRPSQSHGQSPASL